MSDFERRLTEALTSGAEAAPDADRLAVGARRRARSRRRTRFAVVSGAVVVALAVPVGVLALDGDGGATKQDRVATDPSDHSYEVGGWQTVEHEGAVVEIPGGWEPLDTSSCEFAGIVRFGPKAADPCTYDHDGLAFYASATFDPKRGPGLEVDLEEGSAGYVYAGEWAVYVQSEGPQEAMRILGSARKVGQEAPDLSAGFRTVSNGGLAIEVPADWKDGGLSAWCVDESVPGWVERAGTPVELIGCHPVNGYGIRFDSGDPGDWIRERHGPRYPEGSWAGVAIAPGENGKPVGFVQVVAPTQGLAELIGGSLRVQ